MASGLKRSIRSNWSATVLVCRKCSKRIGGGFGDKGKTSLAKALRQELGVGKGRKSSIGIVEVKCLGVCPYRAVTVVNAAAPGRWQIVPAGTEPAAVLKSLNLCGSQTGSEERPSTH